VSRFDDNISHMSEENTVLSYTLTSGLKGRASSVGGRSYIAHMKSEGSFDSAKLSEAVAEAAKVDVELVRYLEAVRRREIVKALRSGKKVFLDGIALASAVRGKFDTIDGTFDANRHEVVVTGYTYGAFQDSLKDVVPQNVVTGGRPTLSRIREAEQGEDEVLSTGQNVTVTGRDLGPSSERSDEGVSLVDIKTGETVSTARILSSNLAEVVCSFASLPSAGRYLLVVSTRAGNGAEYKVVTASREVVVK